MSISKDVFEENTPNAITVQKSIFKGFRSMRDLLPEYEEYLASYNDIITNKKQ